MGTLTEAPFGPMKMTGSPQQLLEKQSGEQRLEDDISACLRNEKSRDPEDILTTRRLSSGNKRNDSEASNRTPVLDLTPSPGISQRKKLENSPGVVPTHKYPAMLKKLLEENNSQKMKSMITSKHTESKEGVRKISNVNSNKLENFAEKSVKFDSSSPKLSPDESNEEKISKNERAEDTIASRSNETMTNDAEHSSGDDGALDLTISKTQANQIGVLDLSAKANNNNNNTNRDGIEKGNESKMTSSDHIKRSERDNMTSPAHEKDKTVSSEVPALTRGSRTSMNDVTKGILKNTRAPHESQLDLPPSDSTESKMTSSNEYDVIDLTTKSDASDEIKINQIKSIKTTDFKRFGAVNGVNHAKECVVELRKLQIDQTNDVTTKSISGSDDVTSERSPSEGRNSAPATTTPLEERISLKRKSSDNDQPFINPRAPEQCENLEIKKQKREENNVKYSRPNMSLIRPSNLTSNLQSRSNKMYSTFKTEYSREGRTGILHRNIPSGSHVETSTSSSCNSYPRRHPEVLHRPHFSNPSPAPTPGPRNYTKAPTKWRNAINEARPSWDRKLYTFHQYGSHEVIDDYSYGSMNSRYASATKETQSSIDMKINKLQNLKRELDRQEYGESKYRHEASFPHRVQSYTTQPRRYDYKELKSPTREIQYRPRQYTSQQGRDRPTAARQMRTQEPCAQCHGQALFLCSACKGVWYCGRRCQLNHWIQHSELCSAYKKIQR